MIRFFRTSRGFDVFIGPDRVGAVTVEPAPAGGLAKGVVFKNIGGEPVLTFASLAVAQTELRRMLTAN